MLAGVLAGGALLGARAIDAYAGGGGDGCQRGCLEDRIKDDPSPTPIPTKPRYKISTFPDTDTLIELSSTSPNYSDNLLEGILELSRKCGPLIVSRKDIGNAVQSSGSVLVQMEDTNCVK